MQLTTEYKSPYEIIKITIEKEIKMSINDIYKIYSSNSVSVISSYAFVKLYNFMKNKQKLYSKNNIMLEKYIIHSMFGEEIFEILNALKDNEIEKLLKLDNGKYANIILFSIFIDNNDNNLLHYLSYHEKLHLARYFVKEISIIPISNKYYYFIKKRWHDEKWDYKNNKNKTPYDIAKKYNKQKSLKFFSNIGNK